MSKIDSLRREFNRSFFPDSLQKDTIAAYHNYDPVTFEPGPGHPEYVEPVTSLPTQVPQLNMPSMDNFNLVNEQTMNNRFTNPQNAQFLQNSPYTVDQPSFDPYSSFRDFNQRQLSSQMTPEKPGFFQKLGQGIKDFFGNPVKPNKKGEGIFSGTSLDTDVISDYHGYDNTFDFDPFGEITAAEEKAAQQDLINTYGTADMNEIRKIAAESYYGGQGINLGKYQMIDPDTGGIIDLPKPPPRPSMSVEPEDEFYDDDIVIEDSPMPNFDQTLVELEDFNKDLAMKDYAKIMEGRERPDLGEWEVDEKGHVIIPEDVDLLNDPEFDIDMTEKDFLAEAVPTPDFKGAWREIQQQDRRDKFAANVQDMKDKFSAIPKAFKDLKDNRIQSRFDKYTKEGKTGGIALTEKDFINKFGEKAGPTEYQKYKDKRSNRFRDRRLDRYADRGKLGGMMLNQKDFIRKFGEEEGPDKYKEYAKEWEERSSKIADLLTGKEGEPGGLASMFMALAGQPYQYQKMFDSENRDYGFPYDVTSENTE
tara:strand:+ start:1641 stop:3242 length:1602 start_codon:yes stop_codon:yes gene_type:complete